MEWYYAEGTAQRGPVGADEFQRLLSAGTVSSETLVWREGMTTWLPYGQLGSAPAPAVGVSSGGGGLVCSQCGQAFAPEQVMRYGDQWVCGGCKPLFLQRMREGGGVSGQAGQLTPEQLEERDYSVEVGESVSRGWAILKENFGLLLGGTVLVYLAMLAINIIPYLSLILSLVFSGPLMGGLWVFYIRKVRGEELTVGEAFAGFGPRFGQLVMVYLASSLLAGLCMVPAVVPAVFFGATAAASQQGGAAMAMPSVMLIVVFAVLALVGFAGFVYLTISWLFALPLVIDKRMAFWEAMRLSKRVVAKHWWGTLGLAIVVWLLAVAGFLACIVGLLFTGPLAMAAMCVHYQKVFGDLRDEAS